MGNAAESAAVSAADRYSYSGASAAGASGMVADAAASAAAAASSAVADSLFSVNYAADAATAAAYAYNDPIFWTMTRADLRSLQNENVASVLKSGLWIDSGVPKAILRDEATFPLGVAMLGDEWSLICQWYSAISKGGQPFEYLGNRLEEVIVDVARESNGFWSRDSDEVMKAISRRLSAESDSRIDPEDDTPDSNVRARSALAPKGAGFFVSYSTKNESEAREIVKYLEQAGYSTIAQFKDFPVGSNFVIEMQEGLERGARAIALLSPEYVSSDHCRAEWAAVYNMDPIGKGRKLVPLLLKPAPLNKLARQIVYKSLVGLSAEERRVAVLEAIGSDPALWSPEKLRARLAETSSPDVASTADGKLDAVPNAIYDRAVYDADLPDLPETLRTLCSIIQGSLPDNCPRTIAPSLTAYGDHLRDRGAKPILGLLSAIAGSLTKDVKSVEFSIWGDGLSDYFDNFFSFHSKFITHFPKSQVREEVIAANEIDEDRASGKDFVEPVKDVAEALGELHLIGGTTPAFERVVQDSLQRAKDIDSLPNDPDSGLGTDVTPKRRFIFTQVGFWERVVASLNNMSSLASTEQGKAAIAILTEAIKKFLSFLQ